MEHNSYFEGKVQSLALEEADGPATVGVIEPGTYRFSTSSEERMTVVAGELKAKLPGKEWRSYSAGEEFVVASGQAFEVEAVGDVAYICRYR